MRVSAVIGLCLLSTCALADLVVYTDALTSGWADWSWSATRSFSAVASPARGNSISFLPTSNWAGLNLHFTNTPFQVTSFSTLQFYTNGGSTAPAAGTYTAFLYNSSGTTSTAVTLPNPISANTWTLQSISISSFNIGSQLVNGIALQFSTGAFTTIFIDDISLVSSVAPTTAPTPAPTPTVSPTTKPVTSAPTTTKPATSAPTTTVPATSAPTTTKPATSAPTTTKPVTSAPTTTKPVTSAPTTTVPVTAAPTTTPVKTSAPLTTSAPSGPVDASVNPLFSNVQTGQGTYYGNSTGGTCTLDTYLPSSGSVGIKTKVAMNIGQWFGSELCGACARVTGTGSGSGSNPIVGTFNVFVADQCPGCNSGDLDLAYSGDGRWGITWTLVPCSPIGNLQYAWQGGVNAWYVKLQIRNHKYPIFKVAVAQGGSYVDLARSNDNFWLDGSTPVAKPLVFPMKLRLTASNGQVVYDQVSNQAENNVIINGSAQFN